MKTKIMASFMAVLLMISALPLVIAEDNNTVDVGAKARVGVDAQKVRPVAVEARERLQVDKNATPRLDAAKQRLANARERLANAADRVKVARENYIEIKESYADARARYAAMRDGPRNANVSDEERLAAAKEFLIASADRMITQLEKLKEVADKNNRTEASAAIQGHIDDVVELKVKIEAAKSIADLRALSVELREIWKNAQVAVAKAHSLLFVNKLQNLIERFENALTKLEERIVNAGEDFDKERAEAALAEAKAHVAEAKRLVAEAEAEIKLVSGPPGADEHFKNAHRLLKEANKELREAHGTLKSFLSAVRDFVKEGVRAEANAEAEVVA